MVNWLLEEGLDALIVRKDFAGKGAEFALGNIDVEILIIKETDTEKALASARGRILIPEIRKECLHD